MNIKHENRITSAFSACLLAIGINFFLQVSFGHLLFTIFAQSSTPALIALRLQF